MYLHRITATSALRLVSGVLDGEMRRRALGAVFQVVAALHATNGDAASRLEATAAPTRPAVRREQIAAKAVETVDDHDVKLAVAALREDARAPGADVLAAAATWLGTG